MKNSECSPVVFFYQITAIDTKGDPIGRQSDITYTRLCGRIVRQMLQNADLFSSEQNYNHAKVRLDNNMYKCIYMKKNGKLVLT